jgi:hypothetical protein
MSVGDCIEAYKKMAERAFTKKAMPLTKLPAPPGGAYSGKALEDAIRNVIKEFCADPGCVARR